MWALVRRFGGRSKKIGSSQVAQWNQPASAEYLRSIPGLGRSHGGGNDNPLQYSCLGNPMDRGAWQIIVHEVAKSRT